MSVAQRETGGTEGHRTGWDYSLRSPLRGRPPGVDAITGRSQLATTA